jgi:hypothetical protein
VLVEGESDAAAIRALANLIGCDLVNNHIQVQSAGGVTNFSRVLLESRRAHADLGFCGMYDAADERHVRRAIVSAGLPLAPNAPLESVGFFACVSDLEDELIRALGTEAVQRLLAGQDELSSFRRFQAMPQHRHTAVHQQLRRFLGTRATRKIRCAHLLVEALNVAQLPYPLAQLAAKLLKVASRDAEPK